MRLYLGGVSRRVGLICGNTEVRQHDSKCHQRDAGANPREKRSLFGEIISQVSCWLSARRGVHFRLHRFDTRAKYLPSRNRENALFLTMIYSAYPK